ncbi:MAG: fused DSP-PTPase phosphatase/NAD kinase-like protein [Gemmataceae bacterium]
MVRLLILASVALASLGLYASYRSAWEHTKRLRAVETGRLYRSGQMTADGFEDAVKRLKIRTVINVQDDFPDPVLTKGALGGREIESALCARLGVRYVALAPDLQPRRTPGGPRPKVIDEFLAVMDREDTYPALIHCKAGLHRTGVLCAVWRVEYRGWTAGAAFRELRAHGFGDRACTAANDYVRQYVLDYRPRAGRDGLALRPAR